MVELAKLDYEKAVEDYEEEMVNLSISIFLEETYEELKQNIPEAYANKDYKEIKAIVHKFKTTAKYMGAFDFAELCDQMQKCVDELNENLIELNALYPIFMSNLEGLYAACLKQNKKTQIKDKSEENWLKNVEEDVKEYEDQVNESDLNNEEDDNLAFNNVNLKKYFKESNMNENLRHSKLFRKATHSFTDVFSALNPFAQAELQRKIQLRYEQAIQKFEVDIVNVIIQTFVTEEYKVMKANLKKAYEARDIKELQACLHTMKLKAKYICAKEFAEDCINIENCIKENQEDYIKLAELFPEFMEDFDLLYAEVELCYHKITKSNIDLTPKVMTQSVIHSSARRKSQARLHNDSIKQSTKKMHHKTSTYYIYYLCSLLR